MKVNHVFRRRFTERGMRASNTRYRFVIDRATSDHIPITL
ncbi:hypothetical protein STRIP9103_02837 [Streptomyces ipomoeae 91-03]|uniref:Uncharacterized protein n=1 Tax=Streptomyces ipomoeae 91-03 TaxID=698759 RepID=L1L2X2_9ACTN|nr:hypothetical protein STRIP9103_02837 [Streptomyces ipomoeae 91-03]